MHAQLLARSISFSRGSRAILVNADLALDPGHRVGVVGPNGVGKSTLLRIGAGLELPEAGTVVRRPGTASVGYLPQEPERGAERVRSYLGRRTGTADADVEFQAAAAALGTDGDGVAERYDAALQRWLALGAADIDARIGDVWNELGLNERLLDQAMGSLSGGEAARVGLAALLLARFDVLLLDEPTNDLDLDGLDRLERFARSSGAAMAIVSHDRTFLQRVVTDVVEIDEFSHETRRFAGGWDAFLREREVAREQAQAAFDEYEVQRSILARRAQREREWATQGLSKVRTSDEKDKHIRAYKVNQTEQLAGRAARTERAIERLDVVDEPRRPWELHLDLAVAPRSGDIVAELGDALVRRGQFQLGPVSLTVGYGERIVIIGPNGSGKSTLVALLTGEVPPTTGTARQGASVVVGRIDQLRSMMADGQEVARGFVDATGFTVSDARTMLAKFGLGATHVTRAVGSLSPGERTRLLLALLMGRGTNCLVLDEPTNHLDLAAIEQIEQALDAYPGTLLLVSHDRTLLERVRRTRTIEVSAGQVVADRPA
jgi:ATPase subunit of ABC transporter with duplicated ATPase domains